MVKPKSVVWRYYDLKDNDNYSWVLPVRNVSGSNNNTTPSSTGVLEDSDTETTSQQEQGESLDSEIALLVRPAPSSASSSFSSASKASKGTISSYFDNMSSQQNNKIDEILARAIYVSGAPLDMTTKKVGICSSSKISRLAVDSFNLPSSTAAIERTFSTYGFINRQRRNRLTVERAAKLTYIAHNYNLLNEEDHSRIVEATDEEIEKEDIGFEVIDLTHDDENDLPLSTLLRSPF
ncbi:ribonuclease h-like superfamily [Holotrichia oblita]|uniref:Ribonuclease h-like superfamily n=1 Tax=Holotrichia oblita TaxID=644536 RepID=A0ACB9SUI4_HOLOL|nr:ribonuclease h-like superfamily [Holotrichia oblita]